MPAIPKPAKGTATAEKRTRRLALERRDRAENAKVRARSGGWCEIQYRYSGALVILRCGSRAAQVHHMIGGRGKRGVGISALAQHKQHVCTICHAHLGGRLGGVVLRRNGDGTPLWTDTYERVL